MRQLKTGDEHNMTTIEWDGTFTVANWKRYGDEQIELARYRQEERERRLRADEVEKAKQERIANEAVVEDVHA